MTPVWLLIPGMLNDSRVWEDVVAGLKHQALIRIADVRTQTSMAEMARDAWSLVKDVPKEAPLYLAGFSMGGYVAIEMLNQPARDLQGLALLSTSGLGETSEGRLQREKTIVAMQNDFPKALEGVLKWNTHQPSPEFLEYLRNMMQAVGLATAVRQIRAISQRHEYRPMLEHLHLPVRVLCGAHDRVIPQQRSEELAHWIPGEQLHVVPGAGHMLPMEQPQAVVDAMLALMNH